MKRMPKKLRELQCSLFGHHWRVSRESNMMEETCGRCSAYQKREIKNLTPNYHIPDNGKKITKPEIVLSRHMETPDPLTAEHLDKLLETAAKQTVRYKMTHEVGCPIRTDSGACTCAIEALPSVGGSDE